VKADIDLTVEIEVDAPREDVWAFISDPNRLPEWFSEFESAEQVSEGPSGLGSIVRYTITPGSRSSAFETVEWEPGSRLSWDGPPLKWMGGGGRPRGSFQLADAGEGRTRFTGHFHPELSGTQVLLLPYLKRWLRRERTASLAKMKALVEGGGSGG
jgi:uncharacterized protein YndB with AHSA1/START domain